MLSRKLGATLHATVPQSRTQAVSSEPKMLGLTATVACGWLSGAWYSMAAKDALLQKPPCHHEETRSRPPLNCCMKLREACLAADVHRPRIALSSGLMACPSLGSRPPFRSGLATKMQVVRLHVFVASTSSACVMVRPATLRRTCIALHFANCISRITLKTSVSEAETSPGRSKPFETPVDRTRQTQMALASAHLKKAL